MAVGPRHPDPEAWHSGRAALHCIHSRRGRREGEEEEEGEEGVAPLLKSRKPSPGRWGKRTQDRSSVLLSNVLFCGGLGVQKNDIMFSIFKAIICRGGKKHFKHHSSCQVGLIC